MNTLDGIGLQFEESLSGYIGVGEKHPRQGAVIGRRNRTDMRIDVGIEVDDLYDFLNDPNHHAKLYGTITCQQLGGKFPIRDGVFNAFSLDPVTGTRQLVYEFKFTTAGGKTYCFDGHKEIYDDPGKIDLVEDMTRLFIKVYRGDNAQAPLYGAGELYFKLLDAPSLAASIRVLGQPSLWQQVAARTAFISFAYGALRDEYLKDLRPFYDTKYENIVVSWNIQSDEGIKSFFLVSGVHHKDFPWGDGETFSDVILAIMDSNGCCNRYCITRRILEGLHLDVERGKYRYQGPIYYIKDGYAASFSKMHEEVKPANLVECKADLDINFEPIQYDTVPFPFPVLGRRLGRLLSPLAKMLSQVLPSLHPLGVHITPHTVVVQSGNLIIERPDGNTDEATTCEELRTVVSDAFGEAECSTFLSIREPTLSYGYICAVQPASKVARVQICTDVLRDERHLWAKDWFDRLVGIIVSHFASAEIIMEGGKQKVRRLSRQRENPNHRRLFKKVGDPIIEVNNDHFPTAVFQRRIVKVLDPGGDNLMALEEDMSLIRRQAINSNKEVTVASVRNDQSKFDALDKVLDITGFDGIVEERLAESKGKDKSNFSIVIKPNFMFVFNKRDCTNFTDPELVEHLIKRLVNRGFTKIAVVEAQSTLGEFYDNRKVLDVAQYLGYNSAAGYDIVDMTMDAEESNCHQYLGPNLKDHLVSPVWRDADFRISFAKNKTHSYAYYTLTLKNIYGALPESNKFKEYHCKRDIYHTTIEYLEAFPVDFGLVDAYLSADGPFGIFSDPRPNETYTVIGGADLVAVDWVAATKMGIDPMISPYMKLAVNTLGKPEINLKGDGSQYKPWLNVPKPLTFLTHKGLDANYHSGKFIYQLLVQMDEEYFHYKVKALHVRLLRKITKPIGRWVLVIDEKPSLGNRLLNWILYKLG